MIMRFISNKTIGKTVSRNIAVLIYFFLGSMNIMAQEVDDEYIPFVEEGKVWNCNAFSPVYGSLIDTDVIFRISGDTLINENAYKKVYCRFDKYFGSEEQQYYCAVREEDCRVFIIESEKEVEKLLYDFSNPQEKKTLSYDERAFIRLPGYHPKRIPKNQFVFSLRNPINEESFIGTWLEGAGNIYTNPFGFEFIDEDATFGFPISVFSCINGEEKYLYDRTWNSVPNSIQEINKESNDSNIYDFQGRRLSDKPDKGLYIQNGKKYVVK